MRDAILREIRDLKAQRAQHLTAAQAALDSKQQDAYQTAMQSASALAAQIDAKQTLFNEFARYDSDAQEQICIPAQNNAAPQKRASREYVNAFAYAVAHGITPQSAKGLQDDRVQLLQDVLTEAGGTPAGADGGFLVPVDLQTRIQQVQRQQTALADYFQVETVTTQSGYRVYDTAPTKGFTKIGAENTPVASDDQPVFHRVPYSVQDYGLILPVSNDLLNDNTAGLIEYLAQWIGKKSVITENLALLSLLQTLTPKDLTAGKELQGLKTALHVALDPAVSATAVILTNQTGYNLLDNLQDSNGRDLLQPDLSQPSRYLLRGRPIICMSDALLPNLDDNKAPVYIGAFPQFGTLIRRQTMEFASTNVGGNAWQNNNTEFRAILRMDAIQTDSEAAVLCTLPIA